MPTRKHKYLVAISAQLMKNMGYRVEQEKIMIKGVQPDLTCYHKTLDNCTIEFQSNSLPKPDKKLRGYFMVTIDLKVYDINKSLNQIVTDLHDDITAQLDYFKEQVSKERLEFRKAKDREYKRGCK